MDEISVVREKVETFVETRTRGSYARPERVLVGVFLDGTQTDLLWLGPVREDEAPALAARAGEVG